MLIVSFLAGMLVGVVGTIFGLRVVYLLNRKSKKINKDTRPSSVNDINFLYSRFDNASNF